MTETYKVLSLEVDNMLNIEHIKIEANGGNVHLYGTNEAGKSSVLNVLWRCLTGKSITMEEWVNITADSGGATLLIGHDEETPEYEITLSAKAGKSPSIKIKNLRTWKPKSSPAAFLAGLFNTYGADPTALLKMDERKFIAEVLRLCNVLPPVDAVSELFGDDTPALDGEDACSYLDRMTNEQNGVVYMWRREASTEADRVQKAWEKSRSTLLELGGTPTEEEREAVSITAITDRLNELHNKQSERTKALEAVAEIKRQAATAEDKTREAEARITMANDAVLRNQSEIDNIDREIERLQALRKEKVADNDEINQSQIQALQLDLDQHTANAETLRAKANRLESALDAEHPDQAAAISEYQSKLSTVEAEQKAIAERDAAKANVDRLKAEYDVQDAEHERRTEVLENVRDIYSKLLADVETGVDGLEIQGGSLKLDGAPFSQASVGRRMAVAVTLATMHPCKLPLLRLDNATDLAPVNRKALIEQCNERGYFVWYATTEDGPLDYEIELIEG